MKTFKVLNRNKLPITMEALDVSAANFWGKEIHPKRYASPYTPKDNSIDEEMKEAISANWFDTIRAIAQQGIYTTRNSWDNVIITMAAESIGETIVTETKYMREEVNDEKILRCVKALIGYYEPYVKLIKNWESMGWMLEMVEE